MEAFDLGKGERMVGREMPNKYQLSLGKGKKTLFFEVHTVKATEK